MKRDVRLSGMNRILVIGATGNVGGEVVSQLSARGAPVRAMVRNPDRACLPSHIEIVRGDLTVPETLDRCLNGIDSVFLVWNAPPDTVPSALKYIVKHAKRIVFLSSPYKTAHPFFQGGQPNPVKALHAQIESLIETSGREWTFLRPGIFASNARAWWGPQFRSGNAVRWPCLSAPAAPIHERDIAAVAVRALCEEGHAGAEYVLTGPQAMTQFEQISTIGRVLKRSLRIEELSPDDARRELLTFMPLFVVNMLLGAWTAAIGHAALVTPAVAEITGAPPHTFLDWATEHAAHFNLTPERIHEAALRPTPQARPPSQSNP